MSIEAVLMKAGNLRRLCEAALDDGAVLTVEPYAIFTAQTKRRHFLWFQVSSSKPAENAGWRQPEAASVKSVKIRGESFRPRPEYDPFDREKLPVVHYAAPTHDGRQRWMDARSDGDKQTLKAGSS
ncbi:MAG: hypothetical protein LC126_11280 [Bryobacterales bacterium]|nr:hypothetical protein [Bryobacterales bacterium]